MVKKIDDILASEFDKTSKKEEPKPKKEDSVLFEKTISKSLLTKKSDIKPKKNVSSELLGREKLKKDYVVAMISFNNCNKDNMEDAFLALMRTEELLHQSLIQLKKVYDYLSKKDGWADLTSYYKYLIDKYQNQTITAEQKKFLFNIHDYLKFKKETLSLDVKIINNAQTKSRTLNDEGIQNKVNNLTEELKLFHKKHIFQDLEFFGTCEIKVDELISKYERSLPKKEEIPEIKKLYPQKTKQILKLYSKTHFMP